MICLYCVSRECALLELVVWNRATGERGRDVLGGVCSVCAELFPNAADHAFLRAGDGDTPTYELSVSAALERRLFDARLANLRTLFARQFPAALPDAYGVRILPFTHPTAIAVLAIRNAQAARRAEIHAAPLPEIVRATPEEHADMVHEAIREITREK